MQKLMFMSNQTILYIQMDQILYLTSRNRKLYLKTLDKEYKISGTIKQYEYLLEFGFKKVSRNKIINYNVITYIDKDNH